MKAITVGFILLIIGMGAVDSNNQVAPIVMMFVGMWMMYKGARNEKIL